MRPSMTAIYAHDTVHSPKPGAGEFRELVYRLPETGTPPDARPVGMRDSVSHAERYRQLQLDRARGIAPQPKPSGATFESAGDRDAIERGRRNGARAGAVARSQLIAAARRKTSSPPKPAAPAAPREPAYRTIGHRLLALLRSGDPARVWDSAELYTALELKGKDIGWALADLSRRDLIQLRICFAGRRHRQVRLPTDAPWPETAEPDLRSVCSSVLSALRARGPGAVLTATEIRLATGESAQRLRKVLHNMRIDGLKRIDCQMLVSAAGAKLGRYRLAAGAGTPWPPVPEGYQIERRPT